MWYQAAMGAGYEARKARREAEKAKRLRLTRKERAAVEYYVGTGGPEDIDAILRRLLKRHIKPKPE